MVNFLDSLHLTPKLLSKYSDAEISEAIWVVLNWTYLYRQNNRNIKELVLWIKSFIKKYDISLTDLPKLDQIFDTLLSSSIDFSDYGLISYFKDRISKDFDEYFRNILELMEHSPMTYFVWDASNDWWPVKDVSKNLLQNFWYDSIRFLNWEKKFADIIYRRDLNRVSQEVHQNIFDKKLDNFEQYYRIVDAKWDIRHVYDFTKVIYDDKGNVVKLYWFIIDITDKVRAQTLEENYKKALDNSAIVQIINREWVIEYVNDLYRIVSWDDRDIIWKNASIMWWKAFHDKEFWKDMWTTVNDWNVWSGIIKNPRVWTRWWVYYTKATITPLRNSNWEIDGFMAIKFDITESEELKHQLWVANARLEQILDSTSQWFWTIDDNLVIKDVNDSFCQMLWYTKEEVIGKSIYDFFDTENKEKLDEQVHLIKDQKHRNYDISITKKDWTQLPIILKATSIQDFEWNFSEAIAFITDITEIKEYQKRLYEMANKDPLTWICNRRNFDIQLKSNFELVNDWGISKLSLVVFDLDHFKRINDWFGHDWWDLVLKKVWEILLELELLIKWLSVYRVWGEEFVILWVDISLDEMFKIMESLRLTISETKVLIDTREIGFTISAWIVEYSIDARIDSETKLYKKADALLYMAKEDGRNNVKTPRDLV